MDAEKEKQLLEGAVQAVFMNEKTFHEHGSEVGQNPDVIAATTNLREVMADVMQRDLHHCKYAVVRVRREEEWVFLEWKVIAKDPETIVVTGDARRIDLNPHPDRLHYTRIANGRGHGKVNLKFDQGDHYLIHFQFTDMVRWEAKDHDGYAGITFPIGIPLSPVKKQLLAKITATEQQIAEAQVEIDMKLGLQAAIDAKLSEGIAQIKARQLSPEEEERQILDLQDTVAHVRDKHGI